MPSFQAGFPGSKVAVGAASPVRPRTARTETKALGA
ncbi:MAG: hypothetical protein A4E67_01927 [Syntrophaceae bacterium PtaB.Bin038]|nr:MAG: hypothetical protein A4E67_01927 [Syntrophaceae bacterium PtaB.Bin038]